MKRTISIDARMIHSTGIGAYLRNLLENIATIDNEFQFQVLCSEGESLPELPAGQFEFRKAQASIYSLREQWVIPRLTAKTDLLHCPHYNIPYFYRGPLVVTIHDLTHLLHRDFRPNQFAYLYARFMLTTAAKRAARIITNSQFTTRSIQERLRVPDQKIRMIYPALSDGYRRNNASLNPSRLRELQVSGPYILFVGLLKPHKNVHGLIRAFARLPVEKQNLYQLVIAGKKDKSYPDLERLTVQLGLERKVVFTGYVSDLDLDALYTGATVFVLPSFNEGFGLPVLEAMAHGVPVVVSDRSSLPEVVGDAGLLVDPYDIQSIANAIEQLTADESLRRELGRRGRDRAQLFSARLFAKKHLEVYREVLGA